ncbi:MAG: HAD hydrolase family protein [Pirellulaceae bacterium]|nr:HAD hydrolase family protein [Planctomycetales bacterium]MCA9164280.1 HAD hydrolase family protein [Planctomycetales bacterium]MCA9222170.1 HAD hydrolase family protein [Planctomycetales bacterium]MCA9223985.1 HAD hydrolase family protein [Planctomycetales bacterium]
MKIDAAGRDIELILSDVDGTLTDGSIIYDNQGIETKAFHIHDGLGIKLWQQAGFSFGLLTARSSHVVKIRAAELGVKILRQGFEDKLSAAKQVIDQLGLEPSQVCYIGDDLPDLPVIRYVRLGVAVADAVPEVREAAQVTTRLPGGRGAVREVVEALLKSKQRWADIIRKFTN